MEEVDDSAFSQELCFQVFFLFEAPPLFVRIYEQADFSIALADPGEGPGGPGPPYFLTKLRPDGPKNFFFGGHPLLISGSA